MARPRILLAWELGGGFGHLAPLRVLARHLKERGWDCFWAVRNLDATARFLAADGNDAIQHLHQAPMVQEAPRRPVDVQLNYASTLFSCGYDDPLTLAVRLKAWAALMQSNGCTRVIADHAPTAVLAARVLGLPTAVAGTGFSVPPLQTPFPAYLPQAKAEVMLDNEQKITGIINQALILLGAAPIRSLQDLFKDCFTGLFTYPETDRYGEHRSTGHLGLHDLSHGAPVRWGSGRERKVFAILNPSPGTDALLTALAALPVQALVKVRGIAPEKLVPLQRPGWVVTDQPVAVRAAVENSDLFVGHAAHGSTVEALLAGKPQLMLPDQRERLMLAQRLTSLGVGLSLPKADAASHGATLRRLLDDPAPRAAAATVATRYAAHPRQRILNDWCDAALAAS
ncbi:MAG: nucleotide disphospho-sugar-binding domain-containing protein [Pseudomonadota bacterium]